MSIHISFTFSHKDFSKKSAIVFFSFSAFSYQLQARKIVLLLREISSICGMCKAQYTVGKRAGIFPLLPPPGNLNMGGGGFCGWQKYPPFCPSAYVGNCEKVSCKHIRSDKTRLRPLPTCPPKFSVLNSPEQMSSRRIIFCFP